MTENTIQARDEKLVRALGVGGLSAAVINMTIGAGIFALPGVVAARLGGAAVLGYLVCAAGMALFVLCFAAAGSRVSQSGGLYGYVSAAFGGFSGFLTGAMLWLSSVLATAAVANIFVDSIRELVPAVNTVAARVVILVVLYAFLAFVNVRGVKLGARFVQTTTVAKLLPLLILVGAGVFFLKPVNLAWPGMPPLDQVGNTAIVLIFAFVGVEVALTPSGEVKDPSRTVPRAVFFALIGVTTLYLLIQLVAQGVLGSELGKNTTTPLASVANTVMGNSGRLLVLVGAVISTFGYVLGDMLAAPRALFGMANHRTLPSFLSYVHPVFRTPRNAIILHAFIATALATSGSFERLIIAANLAILATYFLCAVAVIQLQRKDVRREGEPFNLRGGPVIPIAACAFAVWLASHAEPQEFAAVGIAFIVAVVIYFVMTRRTRMTPIIGE
ncbi:MAG: amino acid permease [Gemmatimonadaceae bacterium]|nr:amino acid permease [Gemmatimonadaceae bacterium]